MTKDAIKNNTPGAAAGASAGSTSDSSNPSQTGRLEGERVAVQVLSMDELSLLNQARIQDDEITLLIDDWENSNVTGVDLETLPFTEGETSSSANKREGLPLPNERDPKRINIEPPGTSTIASASSTTTPVAPEETSLMRLCNAAWAALRPLTGHAPETAEILSMESSTVTLAICDVRTSPIHDAAWEALGPFTTQTRETAKIVGIDGSDVILEGGDGDVRQIQIDEPDIRAPIEAYLEHILKGDGDVRQIQIDDPNICAQIEVYLQQKNYTPPPLKNDIAAKLKEQDTNGKLKYETAQALWAHLEPEKKVVSYIKPFDKARGDVSLSDALADLKTFSDYKKDALKNHVNNKNLRSPTSTQGLNPLRNHCFNLPAQNKANELGIQNASVVGNFDGYLALEGVAFTTIAHSAGEFIRHKDAMLSKPEYAHLKGPWSMASLAALLRKMHPATFPHPLERAFGGWWQTDETTKVLTSSTKDISEKVTEKIAEYLVKKGIDYADYQQNPIAYRAGIKKEIRDSNLQVVLNLIERQAPNA